MIKLFARAFPLEKLAVIKIACVITGSVLVGYLLFASPRIAPAYFMLGQIFFNAEGNTAFLYNLPAARWSYTQAVTLNPQVHEHAHYQLGRTQFILGDFTQALDTFDRQETFFPGEVPPVYYSKGLVFAYRALATGNVADWNAAADEFVNFLNIKPDSPWARVDLAWILFSVGEFESMVQILEPVLHDQTAIAWVHNMHGLAYLNLGDTESAEVHFATSLVAADKLSAEDWGDAYPGNSPVNWDNNLQYFRATLAKNYALTQNVR